MTVACPLNVAAVVTSQVRLLIAFPPFVHRICNLVRPYSMADRLATGPVDAVADGVPARCHGSSPATGSAVVATGYTRVRGSVAVPSKGGGE